MDKAGCWAVCAVDAFLNINSIETTKLESLEEEYKPAESNQPFLQAWDQLVLIAPVLETLLTKAHTEKSQMKYVDALDKVFFAIFFGISSAQTGTYQKNSIAAHNGMKKVTGRNIAYAAIQTCFTLSSVEKWNIPDNHFDYVVFYDEIVHFFEDYPKDEHVVSILADWNEKVFGHKDGLGGRDTWDLDKSEREDTEGSEHTTSITAMARAAREARNTHPTMIS
ncbi:hypothetical protein LENED_012746 [Lentinula edodes]|uniref:Uncharacterized protein n=1 Tax=Lentinula edodes TaxID=5353 RepID=A0A1Q3ETB7_LENED|nr:hypothetical protein LENED_012746 [Lentinula edodes]